MIWKKIGAGILLGLLGFAANWFRIDLFFNIQLLFGSIFAMFSILCFGANAGIVAGFTASLCTWVLWKHPWAVAIMTLEAVFVSLLYRKKISNLPVCDLLYWLAAGFPLVFLFYSNILGLQADETTLVFLKQSINGICNAIIANVLYIVFGRCASKKQAAIPLRQLLFLTISFAALFPPAFFMILNFQETKSKEIERLANEVGRLSDISKDTVEGWVHDSMKNVRTLAHLIGDPDATPVGRMRQLVDIVKAASPQFVRMGVMNRDGISVAYSPQKDKAGNSTVGLDFSDRPYMPIIKNNPNLYIGDVVVSRTLPAEYDLPLIARFPGPEFNGFCGGVVNIAQLRDLFDSLIGDRQMDLILVDRNGRVIIATSKDIGIMAPYDHPPGTPENIEGTNARLRTPFFTPGATLLHRWHGSVVSAERPLGPQLGWKIVAEASLHPLVKTLARRSARTLWAMWGLVIFIVPLAYFISKKFSQSTARLQDIMAEVPSIQAYGEMLPELEKTGMVKNREIRIRRDDGATLWLGLSGTLGEDRKTLEGAVVDISERKLQERSRESLLKLVDFAAKLDARQLLQKVLDEAEKLTDSETGFFHLVDSDQETITLQAWSAKSPKYMPGSESEGRLYPISQAKVWTECVGTGKPVIQNDNSRVSRTKGLPEEHAPAIRELLVPVVRSGKVKAIIGVGDKPVPYGDDDVKTVRRLADTAWEIVERKRAEERLQAANDSLEREVRQRTRELEKVAHEFESLFDSSQVGMMVLRGGRFFSKGNQRLADILGYETPEEMEGLSMKSLHLGEERFREFGEKYYDKLNQGEILHVEYQLRRKDGAPVWCSLSGKALDTGEPVDPDKGVLWIVDDIGDRKHAEHVLKATLDQLERSNDGAGPVRIRGVARSPGAPEGDHRLFAASRIPVPRATGRKRTTLHRKDRKSGSSHAEADFGPAGALPNQYQGAGLRDDRFQWDRGQGRGPSQTANRTERRKSLSRRSAVRNGRCEPNGDPVFPSDLQCLEIQ